MCGIDLSETEQLLRQLYALLGQLVRPAYQRHIERLAQIKGGNAKLIYFVLLHHAPQHPTYFWRVLKMNKSTCHYAIKKN